MEIVLTFSEATTRWGVEEETDPVTLSLNEEMCDTVACCLVIVMGCELTQDESSV
jgi:hypothetical protein